METDYLFARPSALFGMARLFDFFGLFDQYNGSRTPEEADARGLFVDWKMTGQDIIVAFHQAEADDSQVKNEHQMLLFTEK